MTVAALVGYSVLAVVALVVRCLRLAGGMRSVGAFCLLGAGLAGKSLCCSVFAGLGAAQL
jgi:hypothetical protein